IVPRTPDADLSIDPYWTYDNPPGSRARGHGDGRHWFGWRERDVVALRRQERFLCGHDEDVLLHTVEPLVTSMPGTLVELVGYWPDRASSAAHPLVTLPLMPRDADSSRLLAAYHDGLAVNACTFDSHDGARIILSFMLLRRLAADLDRLPTAALT